ncbi:GTP-binding [Cyclospora cayetanensis]|uniref:GTP-binding n=1 Tax=Cyclospora cayetanensis TaxID=88456 RepID=A0A1D3CUV8_9EIME|nr:GTP-binding [Cyclospora cayetanensis]
MQNAAPCAPSARFPRFASAAADAKTNRCSSRLLRSPGTPRNPEAPPARRSGVPVLPESCVMTSLEAAAAVHHLKRIWASFRVVHVFLAALDGLSSWRHQQQRSLRDWIGQSLITILGSRSLKLASEGTGSNNSNTTKIITIKGKSTFFNAATQGSSAKVGSYPFTTITPNEGIAYYTTDCPCKKYGVSCTPRYGRCVGGQRAIPVRLLDVAGLIPGANEGRGLGCKFLDDLRVAHVLLHIIDISGTTNEKKPTLTASPPTAELVSTLSPTCETAHGGSSTPVSPSSLLPVGRRKHRRAEALRGRPFLSVSLLPQGENTTGYDPSSDHEWLLSEVQLWIYKNLWSKWSSLARKHAATNSSLLDTFAAQFSGYGASQTLVALVLQELQRIRSARIKATRAAVAPEAAAALASAACATDDASLLLSNDLTKWTPEDAMELVKLFVKIRFPFVLVLNKCDAGGDVDKNVLRLATKFPGHPLVLTSALAECFLQKLQQQKMIYYDASSGAAYSREDASGPCSSRLKEEQRKAIQSLKPIDAKALHRLEKVRDLMLFRHGGTGVAEVLQSCC